MKTLIRQMLTFQFSFKFTYIVTMFAFNHCLPVFPQNNKDAQVAEDQQQEW